MKETGGRSPPNSPAGGPEHRHYPGRDETRAEKETEMVTILTKVYRGSGRLESAVAVDDSNTQEINRLTGAHGYSVAATGQPDDTDPFEIWYKLDKMLSAERWR